MKKSQSHSKQSDASRSCDLETVKFLRKEGLAKLVARFGVVSKRHSEFPNLLALKYDQVRANFSSMVLRECRGLILDEQQDWNVIAWPFAKFFNAGEAFADEIDWSTAQVYEKLDGSLCTLYWYGGAWNVASMGMPDASGKLPGGFTFAELFWEIHKKLGYRLPEAKNTCYMFELLSNRNRIIVPQERDRLVLIGARDMLALRELQPQPIAAAHGWECVGLQPVSDLGPLLEAARALNPMQHEGWVVCDAAFRRLKVKSPQYVALSYPPDISERNKRKEVNVRSMVEIIRANEASEFLAYYPSWRPLYEAAKQRYDELLAQTEALGASTGVAGHSVPLVKECAEAVRNGAAGSARNFYATCDVQALLQTLGPIVVGAKADDSAAPAAAALPTAIAPKMDGAPAEEAEAEQDEIVARPTRQKKKAGKKAPQNAFAALSLEDS